MTCAVEGCPKPVKTRGWCSAHYAMWLKNGDPGPAGDRRARQPKFCAECGVRSKSLSAVDGRPLCGKHKAREMAHGDATITMRPTYGQGRRQAATGYIYVWAPAHPTAMKFGYALEHRMVAWDAGILTDLSCDVHHKNGVKDDNRLENLEVLTPSEHHRHHVAEAGEVTNQYGTWTLRRNRQDAQTH